MADVRNIVSVGGANGLIVGANLTRYHLSADCFTNIQSTEANAQLKMRTAGTLKNLFIRIRANTVTASSTLGARKNAADGNLTVSIASSTTGVFEDLSNSDSIAATDTINYKIVTGSTGTSLTFDSIAHSFSATTDTVKRLSFSGENLINDSSSYYLGLGGGSLSTIETSSQYKIHYSATLKNFIVNITANARTSTTSYASRKNTAAGAMSVSVNATTTGLFEDTGHTDSLANNDLANYIATLGTGSAETITSSALGSDLSNTVLTFPFIAGATNTAFAVNTTRFTYVGGGIGAVTTETNTQTKPQINFEASNMAANSSQNLNTGTSTITFRQNTASTSLAISIGASTSGYFEDTSHKVSVGPTDSINYQVVTGASGTNLQLNDLILQAVCSLTPNVSDTTTVTESVAVSITGGSPADLNITASDSSAITENLPLMLESYINTSESTTVSDSIGEMVESYINKSDSSTITDSTPLMAESYITKSESTTVTDSTPVVIEGNITKSDTTTITENLPMMVESYITKSDTTTVTENVPLMVESYVNKSDTTTVIDTPQVLLVSDTTASDTTTVTDTPTVQFELNLTTSDSSTVTESVSVAIVNASDLITVSDSSGVAESITVSITGPADLLTSVSDTSTISELPLVFIVGVTDLLVAASDTSTLTENTIVSIVSLALTIAVSDTTTITEAITLLLSLAASGFLEFFE